LGRRLSAGIGRITAAAVLGWFLAGLAAADAFAAEVHSSPIQADPMVREAYRHFYDLDYPACIAELEKVQAAHPGDPGATVLLLEARVFEELYRQDLLDTTFYANDGFLTGHHATDEDTKVRDRIFSLADEAVKEADWRIGKNSNDVDAFFARAWVRSLRCTYVAMVERGFGAGFRLATKARDDAQHALDLDPNYVDAKLIVGIYDYVVGALPWPFKVMIGRSSGSPISWNVGKTAFTGLALTRTTGIPLPVNVRIVCAVASLTE